MSILHFLGTCGGRFATYLQTRSTGGIYYRGRCRLHIDPGPGAVVRMKEERLDPTLTDGILISHCHTDHYTDAEVLSEAMTRGRTERRGVLLGSRSVLNGNRGLGPGISRFHQNTIRRVHLARPGKKFTIRGLRIEPIPARHSDRTAVGFRLKDEAGPIVYTGDTSPWPGLVRHLKGARVLIISNTRPRGASIQHHMTTDDSAELIGQVWPDLAVLTHFGLKLLKQGVEPEAEWVEKVTGVRTVAAHDGMEVQIGEKVAVQAAGLR